MRFYGKKSGKLNEDARQLAFEDLEVARAGIEEKKSEHGSAKSSPATTAIGKGCRPS
ncbi:MAG: hypothetical protein Q4P24_18150 [Rhodobacterales bacterium]|nr:hypothetical protein [Rhodobacterales bacterium]